MKAILPGVIDKLEKAGDAKGLAEAKLEWIEIDKLVAKTQIDLSNTTVFGKIHSQLTQLKNDWTDIGKQVGGFLTQQFNQFASTAGNVISNLIFRTGNWRQSILQLAQSFVSSLATMVIQWVLARTVISALNKLFGQGDTQAANAQAQAAASAWAPAATAASIASYGVAAGVGVAAFLAAVGIGTAGAAAASGVGGGGFAQGGFTFGQEGQFAGFVHGKEFVFSAPATQYFGVEFLNALHNVGVASPGYQTGGYVASGSGGSATTRSGSTGISLGASAPIIHLHPIQSPAEIMRAAMQDPEGIHVMVDFINGNSHMIKPR